MLEVRFGHHPLTPIFPITYYVKLKKGHDTYYELNQTIPEIYD